MKRNRLEAFSDGVLAIVITIMVLEMQAPVRAADLSDLRPLLPVFLSYVLSFVYIGIYWNNHHHLFHVVRRPSAGIMWANHHLLFWLSLIPFVTAWMGSNDFAAIPIALYGVVLFMASIAYWLLTRAIVRAHGKSSLLARALGRDLKGRVSTLLYLGAIPTSLYDRRIAGAVYVGVALLWLLPDRRIERALEEE